MNINLLFYNEREKDIYFSRFWNKITYKITGKKYWITETRVRQIFEKTNEKINDYILKFNKI